MPPHVLMDFVVLPPGHGRSATDFCVWDAHEAHLRCPDDMSGDTGGCSARRAVSILKSSSGSYTFLAKVTFKTVTGSIRCINRVLCIVYCVFAESA